ncbi:hypothetical protein P4679_22445 [Priestia megaterium]|uniref:hypothetical protein n=1 Tax=Priestia megaterium TaxID=1404 RepID=UPI002E206F9F|nr:hypothetical protein [Priestia megaterium]
MIPAIIEFLVIIAFVFLLFTTLYAGVFFFISKVDFLGIYTASFHDAFLFILVLNILVYLSSFLIGMVFVKITENKHIQKPNNIILFLLSFFIPLAYWHLTDILFSTVSISFWSLLIFSLIMAIFNMGNLKAQINKRTEGRGTKNKGEEKAQD